MTSDERILRFLVRLHAIEPQVWRRIEVPSWYSMWDLHVAIQDAMGWLDCHLHAFSINGEKRVKYGIPGDDDVFEEEMGIHMEPGWFHAADTLLREAGDAALYEYDFGDSWLHDVLFEGTAEAEAGVSYPRCTGGAEPCPPENCGSTGGYGRLLEAWADPRDEEDRELLEWAKSEVTRYPPWQPGRFDITEIHFDDPDRRWRGAFLEQEDSVLPLPMRGTDRRPLCPPIRSQEELEIDSIIDELRFFTGRYELEAVEDAIDRRDETIPFLLEMLRFALEDPIELVENEDYFGHIYALMILGHLRIPEAHGIVAQLAALPDDLPHRMFDDGVMQDFPAVLLRTCDGKFETIRALINDTGADPWGRGAGIDALAYAVALGLYPREEALSFLAGVLDRCTPEEDEFIPSHIAFRMTELHPGGHEARIMRAFDEGLIDPTYFTPDEVREALERSVDQNLASLRESWNRFSLDVIHSSMEWWACFDEGKTQLRTHSGPSQPKVEKKKNHRRRQAKASRRKNRKR